MSKPLSEAPVLEEEIMKLQHSPSWAQKQSRKGPGSGERNKQKWHWEERKRQERQLNKGGRKAKRDFAIKVDKPQTKRKQRNNHLALKLWKS